MQLPTIDKNTDSGEGATVDADLKFIFVAEICINCEVFNPAK